MAAGTGGKRMPHRNQRTIRRETGTQGIGFITGADVRVRFLPAPPDHGVVFQRVDLADRPLIPATLDSLIPRQRRTGIAVGDVNVELVEHIMSALAGLWVDNCLVQLDAPEAPGFDGSCQPVVDCLLEADFDEQPEPRPVLLIEESIQITGTDGSTIDARPFGRPGLTISYLLDYGPRSPIPAQTYTVNVTPESFVDEIAFARTFILESEVESLRALGYGKRTTARDLLIFSDDGIIDNDLRAAEECARHKILDCIGDFALIGCDLQGYVNAWKTGHEMNHELTRNLTGKNSHRNEVEAA